MRYEFGPFTFDPAACRLVRDDVPVDVSPRLLDVLKALVAHPGELATKDALIEAGWPDVAVSDNSLTQAISSLRDALGDTAGSPVYIQTVARRGYRFVAPVRIVDAVPQKPDGSAPYPDGARRSRETSSLEAARAFNDGRWRLEALDAALVDEAIACFDRAVTLDPAFAAAWVGLANALFWRAESTRDRDRLDTVSLARALDAASRATALDPQFGEAHATLSYVLAGAGRMADAQQAAERAIALEPGYWAHYFRLGNASWGEARLQAQRQALSRYPDFAFAHLQMAMVLIARQDLGAAETSLRQGLEIRARHRGSLERFPARGLHWLLGLVRLACDDPVEARASLESELTDEAGGLYGREFAAQARCALAFMDLAAGALDAARAGFASVLETHAAHPRALAGLAHVESLGSGPGTDARTRHDALAARLRVQGRVADAEMGLAARQALAGDVTGACSRLARLLEDAPPGSTGWPIPVDPALVALRGSAAFDPVLRQLRQRAR